MPGGVTIWRPSSASAAVAEGVREPGGHRDHRAVLDDDGDLVGEDVDGGLARRRARARRSRRRC